MNVQLNYVQQGDVLLPPNDRNSNSRYSACIRQECGYCCIQYRPCTDANSMTLFNNAASPAIVGTALIDSVCSYDYVGIPGWQNTIVQRIIK